MTTVLHYGILKLVTARYKIGHKQLRPKTKKARVLNARIFHFSITTRIYNFFNRKIVAKDNVIATFQKPTVLLSVGQ